MIRGFTRLTGLLCLWGILVLKTYKFEDKHLFVIELIAIIAWAISEIDWYRKDKKES